MGDVAPGGDVVRYIKVVVWLDDEMEIPEGSIVAASMWRRNSERWQLVLLVPKEEA